MAEEETTDDGLGWLRKYQENPPVMTPEEVTRKERAEAHEAMQARRAQAAALIERLPSYLQRRSLDELLACCRDPRIRKAAETWVPSRGHLLLLGEVNVGKSHGAGYICRRAIDLGVEHGGKWWELAKGIRWVDAVLLEKEINAQKYGAPCRMFKEACEATLCVVDDAGWESSIKSLAPLYKALFNEEKRVILTSAYSVRRLLAHDSKLDPPLQPGEFPGYGEAVWKRFGTLEGRLGMFVEAFPSAEAAQAAENASRRQSGAGQQAPHFQERAER